MDQTKIALQKLTALDGRVTSQIIADLIHDAKVRHDAMIDLYNRYKADSSTVPVFLRTFTDTTKINRQINNAFDAEIVDTGLGYLLGRPIVYSIDKTEYQDGDGEWVREAEWKRKVDVLAEFCARNTTEDLDAETAKMAAICGYGARLCYIDRDGKERVMNVPPWECIWVYDASIAEPQYALRYYTVLSQSGDGWAERTRVEWYDDATVSYYVSDENGRYALDQNELIWDAAKEEWVPDPIKPHLFARIPLICFPNNEEMLGDTERVLELIDAYDRTLSDENSEMEQFRLAYLAFYGSIPDENVIAKAQKTGAFGLAEKDRVEFITKQLDAEAVEKHLDRLADNIMRFGRSVNFDDELFGGNQSGVALKFKMFALESKAVTKERKFVRSLQQQFTVLASVWASKGYDIDPLEMFFEFSRNMPLNIMEEAQATVLLKGYVSEETRLAMLSFVDDPQYELELLKKEREDMLAEVALLGGETGEAGAENVAAYDGQPTVPRPGVDAKAKR